MGLFFLSALPIMFIGTLYFHYVFIYFAATLNLHSEYSSIGFYAVQVFQQNKTKLLTTSRLSVQQ